MGEAWNGTIAEATISFFVLCVVVQDPNKGSRFEATHRICILLVTSIDESSQGDLS